MYKVSNRRTTQQFRPHRGRQGYWLSPTFEKRAPDVMAKMGEVVPGQSRGTCNGCDYVKRSSSSLMRPLRVSRPVSRAGVRGLEGLKDEAQDADRALRGIKDDVDVDLGLEAGTVEKLRARLLA